MGRREGGLREEVGKERRGIKRGRREEGREGGREGETGD